MLIHKLLISIPLLLTCAAAVLCQEQRRVVVNSQGITPERIGRAQQRIERLRHPDFIKLAIAQGSRRADDDGQENSERHKAGDKISFRLMMTNTLSEPFDISVALDPYLQNRPRLFRDGDPVPYRADVVKIIKDRDKYPVSTSIYSTRLEPGKEQPVVSIDFDAWYEPLKPGHYQLSIKHRFTADGEWIESPSITFEVVPDVEAQAR